MAYELKEDGSVWVDGLRVFVAFDRGNLAAMLRCVDKATFESAAVDVGLMRVNEDGILTPQAGTTITELGRYVLSPAVIDEQGNELTPPVTDNRYHVNLWLPPKTVANGRWQQWALQWTLFGSYATPNKDEVAKALSGVELIDPLTIGDPFNKLL